MPRSAPISFDTVKHIALELPGVEESTIHGSPSLKVRGRLLTCLPVHKSAEPGSLAVRIDVEQRRTLIAAEPATYYLTDHYVNHPVVLVRLSRIHLDALKDLLNAAWRFVNSAAARSKRAPARPTGSPLAKRPKGARA